ncbi:hypothetical protein BO221_45770 [Archangium sp. Cb G35]|uniref:NaeI family type II restriction endonuclease n=1 Tax=Archangium sp. Cb G35 TaxID=1920190 RepID=UPI000936CC18|nr:NaeI family type II restriction endonuclease [Archangium sp. Cb G35]OJT17512.1 hypothetical protein BO221_45770 [Archangium sp. Cb G35]
MRKIPSAIAPGHPDYEILAEIRSAILRCVGGADRLQEQFPALVRKAIDSVLDPVLTCRTRVTELDNVEKTFVGLKIEHLVRDMLDVPKGLRDLVINGRDVDIKNTTGDTWMIPAETYRNEDPVLVIASEERTHRCWLGLLVTRKGYLGKPNQDKKRGVLSGAFRNIMWLVEAAPYPESRWAHLDMDRFRELRKVKGGKKRACQFFRENLRVPMHRTVIHALLFDQDDFMKRLRENGGARDVLKAEGIALLSGSYDAGLIAKLGLPHTGAGEMISAAPRTAAERRLMRLQNVID